ncbi:MULTISPECIES: hypothetical protein [Pseudoalteromonas]|uniref:hypothetical protein n=1 Tax=Pseudoalteromonas TaxID=53246 RepID=UPI0002CBCC44|nr:MULTISPECIES: hypothetical protein [Pseudoalteromonas]ENN98702.1 hypothetical protein J139_10407 [Pseudoalteromonas agarivorans S816]TMS70470.1 hypothetical protein CWB83_01775 [Pseudoalteromonas sp. S1691]TMS72112.1 hypothetical protein CWB86_03560 [Pseudoalteromonas sp. S1731]TMS75436.1 hypothetical protein CWB88_00305 [Pseudoalteromonas sp. S1941]TMS77657.1 hypothetical protein CWB82_09225 [Pseudoalteromonas sp. S1690]
MLKKLLPLSVALALSGCGGSSNDSSDEAVEISVASTSTVNFYVPQWQSAKGTLNQLDSQGNVVESVAVENINTASVSVSPLNFYTFEFIPDDSALPCPRFTGCGRTLRGDVNDINENRLIDFEEITGVNLNYAARAYVAPGVNEVFFSPLSTAITNANVDATLASLSASPFYQLTHSSLSNTLEAEIVANAFTYSAIIAGVSVEGFDLATAFDDFITQQDDTSAWQTYSSLADQYIADNLYSEQGNGLIQSVAGQVKQTIASVTSYNNWQQKVETEQALESRELLENIRDALGVIRLQDTTYADDLDAKLEQLESALDDDTQQTITVLAEVINEVLINYSPLAGVSASEGQYTLRNLDISYSTSPYEWLVTGTYDGLPVNIDMSIPTFRISGVLGDKIEGVMSASVINGDTRLDVDVSELLVEFDGVSEQSELLPDAQTGIANITTDVVIAKQSGELTGEISLDLNRFVTAFAQEVTSLSAFDFAGQYQSDIQTTPFHITALEASPLTGEENDDLMFGLELALPLGGASDFSLAYVGDVIDLSQLTSSDVFISVKQKALDLRIREVNSNISLTAKGENGRWLDVKQAGSNYSGGLYLGDTKIADVTAVRGIPGVLFPNGDFESLF